MIGTPVARTLTIERANPSSRVNSTTNTKPIMAMGKKQFVVGF